MGRHSWFDSLVCDPYTEQRSSRHVASPSYRFCRVSTRRISVQPVRLAVRQLLRDRWRRASSDGGLSIFAVVDLAGRESRLRRGRSSGSEREGPGSHGPQRRADDQGRTERRGGSGLPFQRPDVRPCSSERSRCRRP